MEPENRHKRPRGNALWNGSTVGPQQAAIEALDREILVRQHLDRLVIGIARQQPDAVAADQLLTFDVADACTASACTPGGFIAADYGSVPGMATVSYVNHTNGSTLNRLQSGTLNSDPATAYLGFLLDEARSRGAARVLLETGAEDYFAPARRLYARHGFVVRGPFADYVVDPNSVFMELVF